MPAVRESELPRPGQEDHGVAGLSGGRLLGRIVLVSGGAGGIGSAIVELFVAEGASVLVGDVDESSARQLSDRLGPSVNCVVLDVRDPAQWLAAIGTCSACFGAPPDVLVHAAGVMVSGAAESASASAMRLAFDV